MSSPGVYILILNWNGRDDTLACLESVAKVGYTNFKVIVIDNGSVDDSVDAIRAAFTDIEVIETGRNLGFAGGNNVGIKRALELGADYVLLLNNDTEVDHGMLDAFVAAAKRFPDAGVFSGKIYYHAEPNRIWYAGSQWNAKAAHFEQVGKGGLDDGTAYSTACETDTAIGCAFFMPAERVREIGLLDDNFFLCLEETDWCYRAKEAGYPSIFVPDAKLWHKVSVSFGGENSPLALYFQTRNRLLWARRHANLSQRLRVHSEAIRSLLRRFVFPLVGTQVRQPFSLKGWWWSMRGTYHDPSNLAYFMGVRDFWLRRFGDCPSVVRDLAKQMRAPASKATDHVSTTIVE